jgi:hypothetical protein
MVAGIGRTLAGFAEKARYGSRGVYVERAGLGEMLLAKASALGVCAEENNPALVSRGRDLRALAAERFINGGRVKLTGPAGYRISRLKSVERNHLLIYLLKSLASGLPTRKRGGEAKISSTRFVTLC